MEPISALLLNAVVAGAAAALKPAAQHAVKAAYEGLKGYIKVRWVKLSAGIEFLEDDPTSEMRRAALKESLAKALEAGGVDEQVLKAAQALITAVANDRESALAAQQAGVTVEDLKAGASIDLGRVLAESGPVVVRRLTAEQDIRIGEIRSGNPPRRQ
jgi:hypothetical protein